MLFPRSYIYVIHEVYVYTLLPLGRYSASDLSRYTDNQALSDRCHPLTLCTTSISCTCMNAT